jgi:hypothetical protein
MELEAQIKLAIRAEIDKAAEEEIQLALQQAEDRLRMRVNKIAAGVTVNVMREKLAGDFRTHFVVEVSEINLKRSKL